MNRYLDAEAWRVVEKGFNPDNMRSPFATRWLP